MVPKSEFIWLDGELVPWDEANVHVLTHTLHYGLGAFEGIRCYQRADGRTAVFRLKEHMQRLIDSCKIVTLESPFDLEQLCAATTQTIAANKLEACYIRPLIFVGDGAMGLYAIDNPTRVAIITWKWATYLGKEGLTQGVRAKISSFNRPQVNSAMTRGKLVGQYITSIMAKREAVRGGYQEAILLDGDGYITEGSGQNIFMVKNGVVHTTSASSSILEGITRDSIMTLLRDSGYEVVESRFTRDMLYLADEVFFCGTAAEVVPVREIDDRTIGKGRMGKVTEHIQSLYFDVVRGSNTDYDHWLTFV